MQFYLLLRKRASTHLCSHASDHLLFVLQTRIDQRFRSQGARGFRFEEAWLLSEDCERRVVEAWAARGGSGSALSNVHEKIVYYNDDLQEWGATKTHPNVEKIKKFQK